jgi:hypothetical protein
MKLHKNDKSETNDNLKKGFTFDMYILPSYGRRQMQLPQRKNINPKII